MNVDKIIEVYDNLPPAKVSGCKCRQCRLAKQRTRTNDRKITKRLLNKQRRSLKQSGKNITHYWA